MNDRKHYKVTDSLESNWSDEAKESLRIQSFVTKTLLESGNLIYEAMKEKGWKKKDLAKKIGVKKKIISEILSGSETLTLQQYATILAILGKQTTILPSKENIK